MQRIYVDSRSRVSGRAEDFEFAIPISIDLPQESEAAVDSVVIPNSMRTITAGVNDRLYYLEYGTGPGGVPVSQFTIKQVTPGCYNTTFFALELHTILNVDTLVSEDYRVQYNSILNIFEIKNNFPSPQDYFYIQTRERLQTVPLPFPGYDRDDLKDCCRELGMLYNKNGRSFASGGYDLAKDIPMFYSPVLQEHSTLFIRSSSLGMPGTTLSPGNNMTTLRKVVMKAAPLALNIDKFGTMWDRVRLAPQTLSSFRVSLCGVDGKVVNLQGQPWSFSMTIMHKG